MNLRDRHQASRVVGALDEPAQRHCVGAYFRRLGYLLINEL
jgi:hypothetical protein